MGYIYYFFQIFQGLRLFKRVYPRLYSKWKIKENNRLKLYMYRATSNILGCIFNRKLRVVDEYLEVRKATAAYPFLFYILRIEIIGFEVWL